MSDETSLKISRRTFLKGSAAAAASGAINIAYRKRVVAKLNSKHTIATSRARPSLSSPTPDYWFLSKRENSSLWNELYSGTNADYPYSVADNVTVFIGGASMMKRLAQDLKDKLSAKPRILFTDWRLNADRTLEPGQQTFQQIIGELIDKDAQVRALLWHPVISASWSFTAGLAAHRNAHVNFYNFIAQKNKNAICGLDQRVATGPVIGTSATHHQKLFIIQAPTSSGMPETIAYCGGVDIAKTRRSQFDSTGVTGDAESLDGDLNPDIYGSFNMAPEWFDVHLRITGDPAVDLAHTFVQRWEAKGIPYSSTSGVVAFRGVDFSSGAVEKLPDGTFNLKIPPIDVSLQRKASSSGPKIQIWRTMPRSKESEDRPGDLSILRGFAKACRQARQLILICDQYLYLPAFAAEIRSNLLREDKLFNAGLQNILKSVSDSDSPQLSDAQKAQIKQLSDEVHQLRIILIYPPAADFSDEKLANAQHALRRNALRAMVQGTTYVGQRVAAFCTWDKQRNLGIYCHAKTHLYDGQLLVCGSANANRRSLLCDSEAACAVLDQTVAKDYLGELLPVFLTESDSAALNRIDLGVESSGKLFFDTFVTAANSSKILIADDLSDDVFTLPNNAKRNQSPANLPTSKWDSLIEPSTVNDGLTIHNTTSTLTDIIARIDAQITPTPAKKRYPWQ